MSISGKGCEKCNGNGWVQDRTDFGRSTFIARRPCGACSEPWGPQWLDAPDGPGWWWLHDGEEMEPVQVDQFVPWPEGAKYVVFQIGTDAPHFDDELRKRVPAAKWLRITPPAGMP